MNHIVEIRSYDLKSGTRDAFHRLFMEDAYAMLQRWNVDLVAYGPSLFTTVTNGGRARVK